MKRWKAKELLAQLCYLNRKECNLEEFGSPEGDQLYAEKILKFFEEEKDCYKGIEYAQTRDDYQQFRFIFEQIEP